ncbi:hypothetical protein CGLO_13097 [Colletotrichum gloeosporioides Cg-14]|uniref:Uncharacterized protein n=1 Tax=Colletotrichum gloeosporioides (strain Cg-14) TaxID=1237896 RepID=T0K6X2_COLGC|nr:hypothetical protein CGLO_13097 [Colletotrichum gloeosporioides Cg-14]
MRAVSAALSPAFTVWQHNIKYDKIGLFLMKFREPITGS